LPTSPSTATSSFEDDEEEFGQNGTSNPASPVVNKKESDFQVAGQAKSSPTNKSQSSLKTQLPEEEKPTFAEVLKNATNQTDEEKNLTKLPEKK